MGAKKNPFFFGRLFLAALAVRITRSHDLLSPCCVVSDPAFILDNLLQSEKYNLGTFDMAPSVPW